MFASVNSDGVRPIRTRSLGVTSTLCVELEGTLVRSDLLFESLLVLVKRNPLYLLRTLLWLVQGRAVLNAQVAERVDLNPAALAYDRELIDWLAHEQHAGRAIWLCASSNEAFAIRVAAHLGLFDGVLAADPRLNGTAEGLPLRLVKQFGAGGFDYCGHESRNIAPPQISRVTALFRALRPHQWAKNGLVLVPLLAAHRVTELSAVSAALLAFVAFCLCASSVYVLNDLLDLEADGAHPGKSQRPFAAGHLPLSIGCALVPVLLCLAFGIATLLPASFAEVLAGYCTLTLLYSFGLKGLVLVDALALACLYTLRLVAGATSVGVPLSFWMLLFSVFLFLSLALVKRFAELDALKKRDQLKAIGRGYQVSDLPILQSLGCAAGYLSVLVLALYIHSPEIESLYRRPRVIWALCALLLFWVSRVWMMAQRGEMHDDPVVYALKDRVSIAVGVLVIVTVLCAI